MIFQKKFLLMKPLKEVKKNSISREFDNEENEFQSKAVL